MSDIWFSNVLGNGLEIIKAFILKKIEEEIGNS